jgi:hypothetical protein
MRVRIRRFSERQPHRASRPSFRSVPPQVTPFGRPRQASPTSSSRKVCLLAAFGVCLAANVSAIPCLSLFGPSPLSAGTMASADFCLPFPAHCWTGSLCGQEGRSPGISARSVAPLLPDLPQAGLGSRGFHCLVPAHPPPEAYLSGFCSSGRGCGSGFLQTPPHGDALAFA